MAGYSAAPLVKKLGVKEGFRVFVENGPADYAERLAPLPEGVELLKRRAGRVDMLHLFTASRADLARKLAAYLPTMAPDSAIWVSWPKKASKLSTDITEDVIREVALPLGLVDIKVCAVDDIWSGLKLVIRRELRS
jgi:hypothetical protein